jgi:predicted ATPase
VARALAEVYEADIESWYGQIASHFEQAGTAEEAIEYYWRAAAYARQRYADTEAADLLRRALALCRGFSESDRRLKQELDLLVTLGPALVTTEGYSAAEVGETGGLRSAGGCGGHARSGVWAHAGLGGGRRGFLLAG